MALPLSKVSAKTRASPRRTVTLSMPQLSLARPSRPPSAKRTAAVLLTGGEADGDVAVDSVGIAAAEAEVGRTLVDDAHVGGGGGVGHLHLQSGAAGVDDERLLGDDAGVACVVAHGEEHAGGRTEVGAGELDHLADVGRRPRRHWPGCLCRARLARPVRVAVGMANAVAVDIDHEDLALGGGDIELAVGGEGQACDLVLVDALAGEVDAAQFGEGAVGVDEVLDELRAAVDRAEPQVPGGVLDGQAGPGLHVDAGGGAGDLVAGDGVDGDHVVGGAAVVARDEEQAAGRVERPGGEVVVDPERQAGDHRAGGRVHGPSRGRCWGSR